MNLTNIKSTILNVMLMFDDHIYNLMAQFVEESKSLWRIKNNYLGDLAGCNECENFWNDMVKDKEEHIKKLSELIKKHLG